jgi:hypothetical protein
LDFMENDFFCDILLSFACLGFAFIILISKGRKNLGVKALFDGFGSLRAVLSVIFQFLHWMDYLLIRSLQDNYPCFLYPIYSSFFLNFAPFMLTLNALGIISLSFITLL